MCSVLKFRFSSPPFFFPSRFVLPFLRSALSVGKVKKKHKGDDLFSLPCACSHLALVVSFFDLRKPVRPFCTSVRVQKGAREQESERARERESERPGGRESGGERERNATATARAVGLRKKTRESANGEQLPKSTTPSKYPPKPSSLHTPRAPFGRAARGNASTSKEKSRIDSRVEYSKASFSFSDPEKR